MRASICVFLSVLCLYGLALTAAQAHSFDEDYKETINGTTLHFRVRGTDKANPYLVILHGGPGLSAHMFYAWGASLEDKVNVVYLDQRGCGESEHLKFTTSLAPIGDNPENYTMENLEKIVTHWQEGGKTEEARDYTMANLVGDIEGVRKFLKVDRWYVLGHSWGGMLGLEYVSAHAEHVLGYIHMDGLTSLPVVQDAILDNAEAKFKKGTNDPTDAKAKAQAEALLATVKQLRELPPDNPKRFIRSLGLAMGPAGLYFARDPQTAWAALNGKAAEAIKPYKIPFTVLLPAWEPLAAMIQTGHYLTRDDRPLIAQITVPTLVINGKQDGLTTPQAAEFVQQRIKGSVLTLLEDCGHFPFAEQPEKTTEAIQNFFKAQAR